MKATAWEIFVNENGQEKILDIVWFDDNCDADYVRRSLINHDGYPSNINIRVYGS